MFAITGQFQFIPLGSATTTKRLFVNRETKLDEEECVRVSGLVDCLADFILAATHSLLKLRSLSPLQSVSSSERSSPSSLVSFPRVKLVKAYVARINIFMDI